ESARGAGYPTGGMRAYATLAAAARPARLDAQDDWSTKVPTDSWGNRPPEDTREHKPRPVESASFAHSCAHPGSSFSIFVMARASVSIVKRILSPGLTLVMSEVVVL